MQLLARVLVLTIGLVLLGTPASAVVLSPGDIVVNLNNEVIHVDPSTGTTEVIANGNTCSAMAGANPDVDDVEVTENGDLLLVILDVSTFTSSIFRVDPGDGSCSLVAGSGLGGQTFLGFFGGIAVVPAAPLVGASAISDWGIALVVGILLGLSFRLGRRSAARMA